MADLKNFFEHQTLKPSFDKAKELGAVDLYSRKNMNNFLSGKAKIGFISDILFSGETIKEKQARLVIYDKEFMQRLKAQNIEEIKFDNMQQRIEYIESCENLKKSCIKSLELFEQRFKDAIILEDAEDKGIIASHFIEKSVFDDNGSPYVDVKDFVGFYCQSEYEFEMLMIARAQEREWLHNTLDKVIKIDGNVEKNRYKL